MVSSRDTNKFLFKGKDKRTTEYSIDATKDELLINDIIHTVSDGFDIYDLVAHYFEEKVTSTHREFEALYTELIDSTGVILIDNGNELSV